MYILVLYIYTLHVCIPTHVHTYVIVLYVRIYIAFVYLHNCGMVISLICSHNTNVHVPFMFEAHEHRPLFASMSVWKCLELQEICK